MAEVGDSLTELDGVGPTTSRRLVDAGIANIEDLAFAFPRRYRTVSYLATPADDHVGRDVSLVGRCVTAQARRLRGRGNLAFLRMAVGADDADPEARVEATFFGRSYLAKQLTAGRLVRVSGRLDRLPAGGWCLHGPQIVFQADASREGVVYEPVYPTIEGVARAQLRKFIVQAVERVSHELEEPLAAEVLQRHEMLSLADAVRTLHSPDGERELERARRRIALHEAERLLRSVRERRARRNEMKAWSIAIDGAVDRRIRARLPFALSGEQEASVREVVADMGRDSPMARLLQGDVGTGKTLVALYAGLAATAAGLKSVLLVPTEVLAEQHFARIGGLLRGSDLDVLLVTQSIGSRERAKARERLAAKAPCFVVGTHALLEKTLRVERLGFLAIDEQHRFGVDQRGQLFRPTNGRVPHVLVMSATPIPRTMATALYGDLDVSEIVDPPVPRSAIETTVVAASEWPRVRSAIATEVARGGRVFVVCPRIDGDAKDDGRAGARSTARELHALVPTVLAHGRQKPEERRAAQEAFRSGRASCLVATTVVEVGVDVPEATWMVVRDADRLGLSSLHQLRGRVGRGDRSARCILLGDPELERLQILARCSNGFEIAEEDLRQRGAGELMGRLQHGHQRFQCLRPVEDLEILRLAGSAIEPRAD